MPDIKTKYNNGAIVEKKWTEQAIMPQRWTNQAIMPQKWTNQAIMPTPYTDATSYFTGMRYTYSPNKEEEKESYLSNYNDPKEINSLRDVLLGAANPSMKHALPQNILTRNLPVLNIIPDTLQHVYKHYMQATIKDNITTAGLNLLMGLGEDIDTLSNPVKAMIISAYKGDDVGQALIRSTVGDETGIHNYDYDTGNWALDIFLEVFSDPMVIVKAASGIGAAAKGGKFVANKTAKAFLTADTTKGAVKKVVKGLNKSLKIEKALITPEIFLEKVVSSIKQLPISKLAKNSELWKEFVTASNKEIKKEVLKKAFRINTWDEIATAYNKQFNVILSKELSKLSGVDYLKIMKYFDKSTSYYKIFTKTVDDVVKASHDVLSIRILSSIYNTTNFVDDAFTSAVFKAGLTPVGIYPLWKFIKSTPVKNALHLKTMRNVSQTAVTRNLTAAESFLNAGPQKGYTQKIDKDYTLRALFKETSDNIGPQEAFDHLGPYLNKMNEDITTILGKTKDVFGRTYTFNEKKEAIMNVLQSFDSYHKIYSIDEFIEVLRKLQKQVKQYDNAELVVTGLEDYIKQFRKIKSVFDIFDDATVAERAIKKLRPALDITNVIKQLNTQHIFDKYSVKQIINAIDYQDMLIKLGADDPLLFTILKNMQQYNKEFYKLKDFNIEKIIAYTNLTSPINKKSLIDTLFTNIYKLKKRFLF